MRFVTIGVALGTLVFGWWTFWFLTDDAFIEFRYASNLLDGHGLVWNPPPFRPVEGYTSFLWVVVLAAVWAVTGLEPPETANLLSLGCALGTTLLTWRLAERLALPEVHHRVRPVLTALVLLGTVTNRTFLAWASSGLETALFNLLLVGWITVAVAPAPRNPARWTLGLSTLAALCALCRPDGLLVVAATPIAALVVTRRAPRSAFALLPLLAVPAHLLWRRATYGLWLPNTYYAKYVSPWPEAGLRYLASFVLEYGLWVLGLVALASLPTAIRRRRLPPARVLLATGVVLGHVGYYTLRIGGDHFEYRIFSYTIPLAFVACASLASRLTRHRAVAVGLVAVAVIASWPIPWTHWVVTRELRTRSETHVLVAPIADRFPATLRPVIAVWDELQAWLVLRHVCMRHQEHTVFWRDRVRKSPSRRTGSRTGAEGHPVLASKSVGVIGWTLPNVAILDLHGLDDRVIGSTPTRPEALRRMAHERHPPNGYVECFAPNTTVDQKLHVRVAPRAKPLTDDAIRACEDRFWPPSPAGPRTAAGAAATATGRRDGSSP